MKEITYKLQQQTEAYRNTWPTGVIMPSNIEHNKDQSRNPSDSFVGAGNG